MQKDLAKARALVEAGLRTLPAGCRVLATELGFGGRQAPVVVQVGAYSLSVCGSIDRLDQAPDGSWIVVDYKTGRIDDYRDRPDLHVQPLLYALAAEAIHGRPGAVHSARYEGLADGSTVEIPLAGPHRELAIQKLAAFLDYLCRTAHSPDLDPCLVWEEGRWQPGGESARESARPCDTFCPYKNFCPAKGGDRDGRRGGTSPAQLPGPGPGLV